MGKIDSRTPRRTIRHQKALVINVPETTKEPNLPATIAINSLALRPIVRPLILYLATFVLLSIVRDTNPTHGLAAVFQFIWSAAGVVLLGLMAAMATFKALYYNPAIQKFMTARPKFPTVLLLNFGTVFIVGCAIAMNMAGVTVFPALLVPALVALIPIGLGSVAAFLMGSVRCVKEIGHTSEESTKFLAAGKVES